MEHFLWFQIYHFSPFHVATVVESNKISFSPSLTTIGKLAVGFVLYWSPDWLLHLDFTLKCFLKTSTLIYMHMSYSFYSQWHFFHSNFSFLWNADTHLALCGNGVPEVNTGLKNSRLFPKYNCTMCLWQYSVYDPSSRYGHVSS